MPDRQSHPVLLLGGSSEGYALAERLVAAGVPVVTSLAGVTRARRAPAGALRVGGFGGVAGLVAALGAMRPTAVIDATHPFARTMTAHAAEACRRTGTPCLHILRPAWMPGPQDDWREVPDMEAAARALPAGARAWLTVGRSEIAAFADRGDVAFLARSIDPPPPPTPPEMTWIGGKGPFRLAEEVAMIARHAITVLVTKNSGGAAAAPKLEAARGAGIPVVMVRRPPPPTGHTAATVKDALAWLEALGDV